MRCKACDTLLSNQDLKRQSATTGDFIDLCTTCFSTIEEDVQLKHNPDESDDATDDYPEAPEM